MLKKVYFISKIFISVLIIFSMLKSCAKAYSWEDLKEFVAMQKDNVNLVSNFSSKLNILNNNWNVVEQVMSNKSVPAYNNYLIMQGTGAYIYIQMWDENYTYIIDSDSSMTFRNTAVLEIPITAGNTNILQNSGWYLSGRNRFNGKTGEFMRFNILRA